MIYPELCLVLRRRIEVGVQLWRYAIYRNINCHLSFMRLPNDHQSMLPTSAVSKLRQLFISISQHVWWNVFIYIKRKLISYAIFHQHACSVRETSTRGTCAFSRIFTIVKIYNAATSRSSFILEKSSIPVMMVFKLLVKKSNYKRWMLKIFK